MQKIIAKKYHKRLEKPAKAGTRRDKEREEREERKKTIKTKGRARTTADSNFSVVSLTYLTSLASDTLLLGGFEEILLLRHALAQDDTEAYSVVADIQKKKRSAPYGADRSGL